MNTRDDVGSGRLPWTARLYAAVPISPIRLGISIGAVLILLLLVSEWGFDRYAEMRNPTSRYDPLPDFRIAIVHCLLFAYAPTAYVVLVHRTRQTWRELRDLLGLSEPDFRHRLESVGMRPAWQTAALAVLAVSFIVGITYATTPEGLEAFSVRQFSPEALWHRVLGPAMVAYVALLSFSIVTISWSLFASARRIPQVDLFDRGQLAPLRRQTLLHALLVAGAAACASPMGYEPKLFAVVIGTWIFAAGIATIGLVLPLVGVRNRIRAAKSRELEWCTSRLPSARDALKDERPPSGQLAELYAYRRCVEDVPDWALDAPGFVRFALYLLIPIGSWLGGALVERLVDVVVR